MLFDHPTKFYMGSADMKVDLGTATQVWSLLLLNHSALTLKTHMQIHSLHPNQTIY